MLILRVTVNISGGGNGSVYLLIKADRLPVPQGATWTTWRGQGEKRIPMAEQECCSQGPTGCKSYTELLLEVLKDEAEAQGKNGTHRTGRPIRATTMFSLSKRTRFKSLRPHPWNTGVSVVWEQGPHSRVPTARTQRRLLSGAGRA